MIAFGFTLQSCNLDRFPGNSIGKEDSMNTVKDVIAWEAGFNTRLRALQSGAFVSLQEYQIDVFDPTIIYGNRGGSYYIWNTFLSNDYSLRDIWSSYFVAISNCNFVIEKAKQIKFQEQKDKQILDRTLGRAHFLRAYAFFNLALRFGSRYNPSTADKDLCVPLKTDLGISDNHSRSTNKEVYDFIIGEAKKAEELLKNEKNTERADVLTSDAVKAFIARVYLYSSNWEKALEVSGQLIASGKYPLVSPEEDNFKNMWHNGKSTEDILCMFVSKPDEIPATLNYYGASTGKLRLPKTDKKVKGVNAPDWIPSRWIIDLFPDKDLRKSSYFEKQICNFNDNTYELYVVSKYKGEEEFATIKNARYSYWGGYVPNGIVHPKVFRIAEIYLIAAESAKMLNKDEDAKKYLNALRTSRGLENIDVSGEELMTEIKNERTRELAFEGFRLWDMRRWGEDLTRKGSQKLEDGSAPFLGEPSFEKMTRKADDNKFVWGIPSNDIKTNTNLAHQQNPGW